jgi:hypothetical protein
MLTFCTNFWRRRRFGDSAQWPRAAGFKTWLLHRRFSADSAATGSLRRVACESSNKVEKRVFRQGVAQYDQMSQFNPSPHHPKSPVDDIWREEKGSTSMDKDVELPNLAAEQHRVEDQHLQGLGDAKLQGKVHRESVAKHPHMPPSVMNHKSPQ